MAKPKRQRATFFVRFPNEITEKLAPVVNTLRHWNTHYKSMHEWEDGRVVVKYDRRVKDYHNSDMLDFSCPYCSKRLYYTPESVHGVKGHIRCAHCKKHFGVHPSGQVFTAETVKNKVQTSAFNKDKVMKWAQTSTHYLDAHIFPPRVGDEGVEIELDYWQYDDTKRVDPGLTEFVSLLDDSGYEYRRLA